MKKLKKAFTLSELLVALGVIAILCAILLPVIFNMMPNQNTIMAKRAYYTVQTIIADLINDEACYPDKTTVAESGDVRVGFDDAAGSPNCLAWQNTKATDATAKLKTLFFDKLSAEEIAGSDSVYKTPDGIYWVFSNASWKHEGDGGSIKLTVDVNGSGAPNCGTGNAYGGILKGGGLTGGTDCSTRKSGFDRYQMTIYGNGKIEINPAEVWAINAVKVDRNITGDGVSNEDEEDS